MVNRELLQQKIEESGLKISYIVTKLGISDQAFRNKMNGITSFKLDEIQVLCNVLNLYAEDRDLIFFAQNVGKEPTE